MIRADDVSQVPGNDADQEPCGCRTCHPAHAGPGAQRGPLREVGGERDDAARSALVLESLQYARSLFGKAIDGERGVRLRDGHRSDIREHPVVGAPALRACRQLSR